MSKVWESAGDDPCGTLGAWDVVAVGGVALPGIARVTGQGIERRIDVKTAPGVDGGNFTDLGRNIAKFTVTLTLSSQAEWDRFETIVPMLQPEARWVERQRSIAAPDVSTSALPEGQGFGGMSASRSRYHRQQPQKKITVTEKVRIPGKAPVFSVAHPALNAVGIHQAYCTRVGLPQARGRGVFEVELEWLEFRPRQSSVPITPGRKDVRNHERGGTGYPPANAVATKPSRTNTGPRSK